MPDDLAPWIDECRKYLRQWDDENRLPTVRELAKRFKVSQAALIDELESWEDITIYVGVATMGGGAEYPSKGDREVEMESEDA